MSTYYSGICCSEDGSIVYVCKYGGYIYKSSNYGISFDIILSEIKNWTCISCDFTGNYVIAGEFENVWISTDGNNFIEINVYNTDSITNVSTKPNISEADNYIFGVCIKDALYFLIDKNLNVINPNFSGSPPRFIYLINSGFYTSSLELCEYYDYNLNMLSSAGLYNTDQNCITANNYGLIAIGIPPSIYISNDFLITGLTEYNFDNKWFSGLSCTNANIIYGCNNDGSEVPYLKSRIYKISPNNTEFVCDELSNSPFKLWKGICCSFTQNESQDFIYAIDSDFIYTSYDSGNSWTVDCFLENTKIRIFKNNKIYEELIQNLKKGDLIMINEKDYRPIYFIGYNFLNTQQLNYIAKIPKNKLKENFPNEDLFILTGHSLLFKTIPDEIKNEHYNPNIYNTTVFENYEKIIALHTNLYETPKINEINIINNKIKYFHFALENENLNEHYAIYSNNLQTESMTLNYIKKANLYENI